MGSAAGFFLEAAKEDGWTPYGVEISDYSYNYSRDKCLNVYKGDFCKMEWLDDVFKESLDVITFWDCIEHLIDPKRAILRANKCLKEEGLVVISTGDIESLNAKISGIRWSLLEPPYHLYYFSQNTITRMLEESGFRVIEVSKKEGNITHLRPRKMFKLIGKLLRKFNLGDIMTIYARKSKSK